ncbi:MAG: protein kinase domain-containing protein [Bacillota bacterium]
MTIAPLERLRAALGERYRVEREIGTGGMASVFLAEDLRHHRRVAIKVLRPELAAALGADRFLQEIQLTANLQHPHILPLFDSGEADGLLFYVMPYVEGETLRDRLDREKQLPIGDAVRLARESASALDYAHRRGIIHRDIKPENILLHDGSALVADFGIALAAGSADDRLTASGISLGTPYYMSPEQALGQSNLDARCDVYALGATLYEMLTGTPPFTGATAQAVVAKVITETPAPPARRRSGVPAAVSDAVLTALRKDPDTRFPTAAAFQAALEGRGLTPRPRRQAIWLLPALAAVVLLGAYALFGRGSRSPGNPAVAAGDPATPRRIAVIPFRNANGDTDNASFSEGLSLEINDALSRLPGLTVIVASSSRYRAAGMDVVAAGRELAVDAVLTGRVDAGDSLVRVQAQLQDVRTQALRWSAKYDRPKKDLYALEDTLSQAIAADLRVATTPTAQLAVRAGRTASPEAHALLVQARGNAEQRTPAALAAAITLFTAAINLDSSYAQAWAGRANAENLAAVYGTASAAATFPIAKADAMRAVELDSTVADAHTTLGFIHVFYDRDWPAAGAEFSRSLALDSTAAATWMFRAWYFTALDEMDSAVASLRTAVRRDPVALIYRTRLGTGLYFADDLAGAESTLLAALRQDSTYTFAHRQLAQVYADAGQCGKALAESRRESPVADYSGSIAYAAARCGNPAPARQYVAEFESLARAGKPVDGFWVSTVYASLHDDAKVFEWLNRAVAEHSGVLFMLRRHPALREYRNDPRFKALVHRVYDAPV